ncbi:hypothetical protein [Algoriphagus vanfongensis]|uniref:hypothetical protein n=1 Tax=Algoriphagus vanfongensis TaxID=426371 RepID=UPI0012F808AC|nr:hypothetical protein [Algoriphagus vanfongensis]
MQRPKLSLLICSVVLIATISSCSCNPEKIASLALRGMETMMGDGFMPSDEIRHLGEFQHVSVNLSKSTTEDSESGTIFLKLQDGDPLLLGNQPEILARKCAEIYVRDFENSSDYQQITVQFIQTDPQNPDNFAMQEYEFQVEDLTTT